MPLPIIGRKLNDADLDDAPNFEKGVAKQAIFVRGNNPDAVAHTVSGGDDMRIAVDNPNWFSRPVMAHELTHLIQNKAGSQNYVNPDQGGRSVYDYGGINGLKVLGSISKLNDEQQANIPSDYLNQMQAWTKQAVTPKILQQADQLNSVYARPIHQLANMANPSNDTIDTTPQAPGPPPATLTGMIKPLPEMGGNTLYRSK
jgi:hypothetical protein